MTRVRKFPAFLLVLSLAGVSAGVTWAAAPLLKQSSLDEARGVLTVAPLLEKVTPGVVNIAVKTRVAVKQNPLMRDPFFRRFFDMPEQPRAREGMSAGSGVIVDATKGYVLTNNHVIDNATAIEVTLKDRRQVKAKLVGADPATDIALLQIEADNLTAVPFGDSEHLKVGDVVIAIGNPFGIGQTVTSGIVSALGRTGLGIEGYEDFIQTDASINPGNSGGALINSKGELVGINTAIIGPGGGNVGIGFAVPVNMAHSVMRQLADFGEVRRGRLGVAIQDLTPEIANALDMKAAEGAIVSNVEAGSPAAKAGLKAGDVVVALNGEAVANSADLRNRVGLTPKGETVTIEIVRDGKRISKSIEVGAIEADEVPGAKAVPEFAGATFSDMPDDQKQARHVEGVAVAKVEAGSPAWRYGLRDDDVIVAVNRVRTPSVETFTETVKQAGKVLALNVLRGDADLFLVIQRAG
ncbi:MAG: DegQ family serine endoprotease [Rhodospirillaceae bacterium]